MVGHVHIAFLCQSYVKQRWSFVLQEQSDYELLVDAVVYFSLDLILSPVFFILCYNGIYSESQKVKK